MTEKQRPKTKGHAAWVLALWKERKWLIALMFFLTLFSATVSVATPLVWKVIIDSIVAVLSAPAEHPDARAEITGLLFLVVGLGLAGILQGLFPSIRGMMNCVFEYGIRKRYFSIALRKEIPFFGKIPSGDIITRLTDDIDEHQTKLAWFLCSGIFRMVEAVGKIAFCVIAMAYLHPALTLMVLTPIPFMAIAHYFTQDRIYAAIMKNQEAVSAVNAQLETSFSGARVIKAFACETKYRRFFEKALARRFSTELTATRLDVALNLMYQYIDYLGQIVVIVAGGAFAMSGEISIGTFYAFYSYLGMIVYPVLDIPMFFVSAKRGFVSIDRLRELETTSSTARGLEPGEEGTVKPGPIESLEFRSVSYKYDGREDYALRDVSFSIAKGETACLVGPVGSGKTTAVKLMLGLLEPVSGEILVNGVPMSRVDLAAYRERARWVPQDPLLFTGTIRENVEFGVSGTLDDESFRSAVRSAQLETELDAFPEGENSKLAQRGSGVSGGQRQRIACARAMAGKPELLVLDDVTASLDAANEARLLDATASLGDGVTCVMVSHRMSSLNHADKAIFLDRGEVKAAGCPRDLLGHGEFLAFMGEN